LSFDFDVAIVGGGPAGTSTALHLARVEGLDPARVLVLEKATHPRDKPCAGAISAWGLRALAEIGIFVDVPHVAMNGLRVMTDRAQGAHLGPLGVVVRRCEFDFSLWRRAAEDGIAVNDGEPLLGLARMPGGWRLRTRTREVSARLVAACDGSNGAVRKTLGLREPARKGHLYVTDTALTEHDDGVAKGLCDFDLRVAADGVEGYYWDFPTVLGVSRGIYHANFRAAPRLKAALGRALARRGIDIAKVELRPFSTRPLVTRSCFSLRRLVFVGEAAGIDATTGEGIAQAIIMGAIAAKHLARALRAGEDELLGYGAALLADRVGRHLRQSAWLAERVYGPDGAPWRDFLAANAMARAAGALWYSGLPLTAAQKARLGVSLGLAVARARCARVERPLEPRRHAHPQEHRP
jgi:flavin-dependent dehydrogenase